MSSSKSWQDIAQEKRAQREKALYSPAEISIKVPEHLVPKDPEDITKRPQSSEPVIHIPDQLLNAQDREITSLSVAELLYKVRNGTYTTVEAVTAYIRRASIAQQLTNCLTEPLFEKALERARSLDRTGPYGPLHGLPISIKDSFNIAGVDSSIGIASLCFKPAKSNAPMVDMLESLGCVIIAKTNVPQTMASLDSVNNVFGRTMNPYNRLITAGGSSGGEGALVAMGGSAIGIGTDIGGSIRIPAWCNGLYGFKPSLGRLPFGGSVQTGLDGVARAGVSAVAGPIARRLEDIDTLMREIVPKAYLFGEDCIPAPSGWMGASLARDPGTARHKFPGSGPNGEFVIGVLRSDGNCQLLPPIRNLMDDVSRAIAKHGSTLNVQVVDLPTPKAWTKAQSVMSKLMGIDGGSVMSKLILDTEEPLVPWMSTRFKHGGKSQPLERVTELQAMRSQLEREMLRDVWRVTAGAQGQRKRGIDAVVCPLAPHPVPKIEGYNSVGYTSSWVLFDYPAGNVPYRLVDNNDLEIGQPLDSNLKVLGSWDKKSRELWDETQVDRKVYLDGPLGVQVVTARLEDEKLSYAMGLVDEIVRRQRQTSSKL